MASRSAGGSKRCCSARDIRPRRFAMRICAAARREPTRSSKRRSRASCARASLPPCAKAARLPSRPRTSAALLICSRQATCRCATGWNWSTRRWSAGLRRRILPMSTRVVRAACPHDCPDTCGMLVTVKDGVAVKIQGDPSMPFTEGTLCTKVAHYLERTYSPDRVLYPQKRIGRKGEGRFRRISWDEALDDIAARLKSVAAEDPQGILPCSYAGTMGMLQYSSMDRRFFHQLGSSQLERTLCSSAGKAGIKATLGGSYGMDPERFPESKLILIWGSNPIVSNLHFWSRAQEAKRRGAKLIAIDPYRSLTAEKCTQHIAPLPGTDAALALGMMHVLIAEDLIDRDYVSKYTIGFEALSKRVLEDYSPARVAEICGLRVEEVVQLARDYGGAKPAGIRLNY